MLCGRSPFWGYENSDNRGDAAVAGPDFDDVLLHVDKLKKYFPIRHGFFDRAAGWVKAVENVSFSVGRGKTLGLVGESGCGKTTVGRLILRLIDADGGNINYNGQEISTFSARQMAPIRKELQIIFQDPFGSLNPRMSIGATIEEGLRARGITGASALYQRVHELLELVGITGEMASRYPHEFSGGQRQRIGIARALSAEPSLIVCDEPVSALDVSIQAQILNLLKGLQDKLGLSYLFISHDLNVIGYLSDAVAVMYLGEIVEYALVDELYDHPLHPYTTALFSALPAASPGQGQTSHAPISGDVISPVNHQPGCKFQSRCPLSEPRCGETAIDLSEPREGHFVRCWKAAGMTGL